MVSMKSSTDGVAWLGLTMVTAAQLEKSNERIHWRGMIDCELMINEMSRKHPFAAIANECANGALNPQGIGIGIATPLFAARCSTCFNSHTLTNATRQQRMIVRTRATHWGMNDDRHDMDCSAAAAAAAASIKSAKRVCPSFDDKQ